MTLTSEKITVTHAMMSANNMTRGGQYGIPTPSGLVWKSLDDFTEADYDAIEEYFMNKAFTESTHQQ